MAVWTGEVDVDDDRALVHRFQDGDQAAFDELYTRHLERLRRFCRRKVFDHHLAEEIAQEAFVKAFQALPRLQGDRHFYAWLTVIAGRLCIDHHRREGRVDLSDDLDPGVVDGDHGTRLAHLDDLDDLDAALARLGPRHREVLDLREHGEMSYAAIAEHLSVPRTTVEALLHRARLALKREFEAVAGGRLAGIPGVAWVARRLSALRSGVADHLPSLSQLAGPVAAGAMAAGLTLVPPLVGDRGSTSPSVVVTGSATVAAWSSSSAAPSPGGGSPADAQGPAGAPAAPATTRSPEPEGTARPPVVATAEPVPGATVGVGDDDAYEEAAEDTRRMPLHGPDGPVLVGADPDAAVTKLDEKLFGGTP